MPIKSGTPHCINHPEQPMQRDAGFKALTTLERLASGQVNFNPASGIPVAVFYCDQCGYIELYAAQKTLFWDAAVKQGT